MNTVRWTVGAVASALWTVGAPASAQDKLDIDALKRYGGSYSADCANPAAPRLSATIDALQVEHDNKRISGRYLHAAKSVVGQATPPANLEAVLVGEVRSGLDLDFLVYRDQAGLYIVLDGHPHVQTALGDSLLSYHYRRCGDATVRAGFTPAASMSMAPQIGPADLLKDSRFRTAYFKALGPLAKEPWLARLDGPAPPVQTVAIDGVQYLLVSACKAHDCADNNAVMLYLGTEGTVYGRVVERGRTQAIGTPTPAVERELERLWMAEWQRR